VLKVIAAIVPSAGLLFLFWLALRALIEADRRERAAEARLTRQERSAAQVPAQPSREAGAATGSETSESGHTVEAAGPGDGVVPDA
jgi:threonine/homoserine/homoserine lactone efflux protein